jgi:hypothetical protein
MSIRGRTLVRLAGLCMILAAASPALGAILSSYTYNFDRGNEGWVSGTGPNGYDNWTGTNGRMQMLTDTTSPMSGWTVFAGTVSPYTLVGTVTRTNNANFSFSIPANATGLELLYSGRQGYSGSGRYTRRLFGLGNAANPYRVRFGEYGAAGTPYYYINSNSSATVMSGAARDVKIVVDFAANSGAGGATMYYDDYVNGWQLIKAAWTNINLGLTPGEWAQWNRLYLEMNGSTRIDNLRINVIPEPAAMSLLAVGGIGIVLRRRRR